jgi:hypothetical protein
MKFTATEIRSIERTMDKLTNVAFAMWDRENTDAANARAVSYIIGELRTCADLMQSNDRSTRLAAADRLTALITK